MRPAVLAIAFTTLCSTLAAQAPSAERIREIIEDRVDGRKASVGIVVGVVDASGPRIVAHGAAAKGGAKVDGDTLFEIGSVTKVFTSLLVAEMAERGELSFDEPVAKFLPEGVSFPPNITLQHLAEHTSGLPRLPSNFKPADSTNPYRDYSVEQLYAFLGDFKPTRGPGEKYVYSNVGAGLLGHILELRSRKSYEKLVQELICEPLGMESTRITIPEEMRPRFAHGHDRQLQSVPAWDLPTLAGAGALRSSVDDMLKFVAANLGFAKTPLAPAMAGLLETRVPTGGPAVAIARAWHVTGGDGGIVWHNGGTGGFHSFIGFSPSKKLGVVVLSNAQGSIDDIGMHLLDPSSPLSAAPRKREEVSVNPEILARYVGRYELLPNFILTVTREDGRLFAQATGQGRASIFAESDTDFFYKVTDAQIIFEADGKALTLHQNGRQLKARRLEE